MSNNYGVNFMAGPLSGILEVMIGHPLDRIKTELQILSLTKHDSKITCAINSIYSKNKFSGFYLGMTPRLIGIVPMRFIYWGVMRSSNEMVKGESKVIQYFLPGIITGICQTVIDSPIELLKVRLMSGGKTSIKLKEIYTGFTPCLLRNVIFALPVAIITKTFGTENPILAGALGGFTGSAISQPFDVVKTEMQRSKNVNEEHKKPIHIIKDIYKTNPLKLWSGGLTRCVQGGVNMGVGFFAIHQICKILGC